MDGFDDRPWRPEPPAGPIHGPRRPPQPPQPPPPIIELLPPGGYVPAEAVAPPLPRPRWRLSLFLFVLTFLCTTTMSAPMYLMTRTDATMWPDYGGDRIVTLSPTVIARVWGNPHLLHVGLTFAFAAMTILLAHEMGHYVACRRYKLPCTPPYFLPVPINFGTFGAFIRIQAPIRSKRELFDVGVAGPIAGFVALIPFLLYGIAHSEPVPLPAAPPGSAYGLLVFGRCLAVELAVRLFHGPLAPGMYLNLHPAALGAWLGLLATAINLLPLGQLDGGHILYAVTGRLQKRLALPLWILLAVLGLHWPGWLLWCVIVLLLGLRHPPVRDELTPLDPRRRWLALLALALLVLSFMPVPIDLQAVFG